MIEKKSAKVTTTIDKTLTKYKNLDIYLKSGQIIQVKCESWEFNYSQISGVFTGYTFKGIIVPKFVGIDPSQIAAYIEK